MMGRVVLGSRGHGRRNYDEIFRKSHPESERNRYIFLRNLPKYFFETYLKVIEMMKNSLVANTDIGSECRCSNRNNNY